MNDFTISIVHNDRKNPVYGQLYNYITGEIKSGRLTEGERLPSKKSLAAHLGISANTVETAYYMLLQEGYVVSKPRSGYFVCAFSDYSTVYKPADKMPVIEFIPNKAEYKYDFRTNAVDTSSFPFRTWAKLGKEVLYAGENLLSSGDTQGDIELRESLCKYLREFRAVSCTPSQLVIGAGIEYLLMLLDRLLPDSTVYALENPGYKKTAVTLGYGTSAGGHQKLAFLPLDKEGMIPAELYKSPANIAYITPSHQFPTGIIMPVGRRQELLKWVRGGEGRYIIEDDYNSEFNFIGKPIPSMQGMDGEHVIYMSTFSRILAPSIRIAYMALPPTLLRASSDILPEYSSSVSRFEQHTLERFIRGGYLGRHLNRVKTLYRKRKDFLIEQLKPHLKSNSIKITGDSAGLHLLLSMPLCEALELKQKAERASVKLYSLTDYYYGQPAEEQGTLILGYAGMDYASIAEAVRLLFA